MESSLTYSIFLPVYLQYMILIVMIFMVESVMGLLSYVYQDLIEEDLNNSLENIFIQLYNEDVKVTKAVDQIQQEV